MKKDIIINKKITRRKLLWMTFKNGKVDKVLYGYLGWFFVAAVPIWLFEPGIHTYADSLWYCFITATSIGFGDLTAVTVIGRIVTVLLSVYSIAIIAICTACITSFYADYMRLQKNESTGKFIYELRHLDELSKEELAELSKKIRDFQDKK